MSIARFRQLLAWRPGQLARNTAHAGAWNVARIVLQAASLVLMARVLGAEGYGALAGTVALYVTFAQFTGLGTGIALVRHLSRAGELQARLTATQLAYVATGLALFAVVWPLSVWVLGGTLSPSTLACLAIAELCIAPALLPLAYRYQAEERTFRSGATLTLAPVARFGAVTSALILAWHDVATFALLYLAWLVMVVGLTLYAAWPRSKAPSLPRPSLIATVHEGLPYVVGGAAMTASSELDKTFLLRSGGEILAGQYAAAYRIMQAATLPVNSLILAAAPRMFRANSQARGGIDGTLFAATLAYALVAALFLALLAPFTHIILGEEFIESETLLRWLCFVVLTNCIRQLVTAHLTASDMQTFRNLIELVGLSASLALMLILIPSLEAWGAIIALAVADFTVIALGFTKLRVKSTEKYGPPK